MWKIMLALANKRSSGRIKPFSSLSRSIKLVMAIVIFVAIKTLMAIINFVAIKTVMAIMIFVAIKTVIGIKTNRPLSKIEPSIKYKELVPRYIF